MTGEQPKTSGDYTYDEDHKRWSKTPDPPPEDVLSERELRWLEFLRWRLNRRGDDGRAKPSTN